MTQLEPIGDERAGLEADSQDAPRLGRKRDHTRDPDILEAALDILAETGYDGMTVDMVAARVKAGKATIYRRWPSKAELVIDAVACMKAKGIDWDNLPDTGSLRGDLIANLKPHSIDEAEKKLQVMSGLISMLSRNPELADAVKSAVVDPRASVGRLFLQRAMDRGEIPSDTDIDTLSMVMPSMATYRVLMLRKPVDRDYMLSIIDGVVLPAVGLSAHATAV